MAISDYVMVYSCPAFASNFFPNMILYYLLHGHPLPKRDRAKNHPVIHLVNEIFGVTDSLPDHNWVWIFIFEQLSGKFTGLSYSDTKSYVQLDSHLAKRWAWKGTGYTVCRHTSC